MIPRPSILLWEDQEAPWLENWQIEHDLMMSRVLVEIFSHKLLSESLLFRGGTALGKLHFSKPHRFSEDLDLVQVEPGPIKQSIQKPLLHEVMDELPLELKKYGPSDLGYSYFFDFDVRDPAVDKSRLKIEINTREHFTILDPLYIPYQVSTDWFEGTAKIRTHPAAEMMAHKLLALYDRKKGRDLFDLWYGYKMDLAKPQQVLSCYEEYVEEAREAGDISRAQFELNLSGKIRDAEFREDTKPLLREGIEYEIDKAVRIVHEQFVSLLDGDPYQGEENIFRKDKS